MKDDRCVKYLVKLVHYSINFTGSVVSLEHGAKLKFKYRYHQEAQWPFFKCLFSSVNHRLHSFNVQSYLKGIIVHSDGTEVLTIFYISVN